MQMRSLGRLPVHILAIGLALTYAGYISQSAFVTTGLQFVTPLLIIMAVHLTWLAVRRKLVRGFTPLICLRSLQSAIGMAGVLFLGSLFAPQPAQAADSGDVVGVILMVLFCVAVVALIAAILGGIFYALIVLARDVANLVKGKDDNDPDSRLFDIASLCIVACALGAASLEGVTSAFTFKSAHQSEASFLIDQSPDQVWEVLQTATSPEFPLPSWLALFPQPVAVVTDEGTDLGAMRRVAFEGREGAGHLTLQVVERSQQRAVFQVLSDTTPYGDWLTFDRLTYHVDAAGEGTRLAVTLDFERHLAPSWFFTPAMKSAAHLAVGVLGRDVKARAESGTAEVANRLVLYPTP